MNGRTNQAVLPQTHQDEFPAEYSLAGCSPAEPASASSAALILNQKPPVRQRNCSERQLSPSVRVSFPHAGHPQPPPSAAPSRPFSRPSAPPSAPSAALQPPLQPLRPINELKNIATNLDPKCAGWLTSGLPAAQALAAVRSIISGLIDTGGTPYVAVGQFDSASNSLVAFTNVDPAMANVPVGYASITVNTSGAFFNSAYTVGPESFVGGTGQAQAAILIHELAHLLGAPGFQPDLNNAAAGKSNDNLVNTNCAQTINDAND